MNNLLLIDLNWTYNRFFYVKSQQSPQEPQQATNKAMLEFLSYIHSTREFDKVFVIVDGAHPRTKEIYEGYKAGRSDKSQVYAGLKEFCKLASKLPNTVVLQNDQAEADELIAYICYKHYEHACITIYSGDKDLLQLLVYPNVRISSKYEHGKFLIPECKEVLGKFSNSAKTKSLKTLRHILPYRVLRGDTSDHIPAPIKRLKYDKILTFLRVLDTSPLMNEESFVRAVSSIKEFDETFAQQLLEAHDDIFRNYKLMSLLDFEGKDYITESAKRWQ